MDIVHQLGLPNLKFSKLDSYWIRELDGLLLIICKSCRVRKDGSYASTLPRAP